MPKIKPSHTKLSLDNIPIPKKKSAGKPEKLNLLYKKPSKMKAFRMRVEAIEALEDLTQKVNKHTNFKFSSTKILELLILDANKANVDKFLRLIRNEVQ
jgi:hypothetical protein